MNMLIDMWRQIAASGAARLRERMTDLALTAAIGLCLVTAAGFGLSALHGLLRDLVGPAGASALLSGVMLFVALALALWLSDRRSRAARAASKPVPSPSPSPVMAAAAATSAMPEAAPADLGASAAFLAGFLLARRLF